MLIKTVFILPVYNEDALIVEELISNICGLPNTHLVIVNDGSEVPLRVEHQHNLHVVTLPINMGQGFALSMGVSYAERLIDFDWLVTMDSDGQHRLEDYNSILPSLYQKRAALDPYVFLGDRFSGIASSNVPNMRRLVLHVGRLFIALRTGTLFRDVHNGYRIFSKASLIIFPLASKREEHATEILIKIVKLKIPYEYFPTSVRYTNYSISKGQKNLSGIVRNLHEMFFGS